MRISDLFESFEKNKFTENNVRDLCITKMSPISSFPDNVVNGNYIIITFKYLTGVEAWEEHISAYELKYICKMTDNYPNTPRYATPPFKPAKGLTLVAFLEDIKLRFTDGLLIENQLYYTEKDEE